MDKFNIYDDIKDNIENQARINSFEGGSSEKYIDPDRFDKK